LPPGLIVERTDVTKRCAGCETQFDPGSVVMVAGDAGGCYCSGCIVAVAERMRTGMVENPR
jgi:hypothetical protein